MAVPIAAVASLITTVVDGTLKICNLIRGNKAEEPKKEEIVKEIIKDVEPLINQGKNYIDDKLQKAKTEIIETVKKETASYRDSKIKEVQQYIGSELSKFKTQIVSIVAIGLIVQTALILGILFLFFK